MTLLLSGELHLIMLIHRSSTQRDITPQEWRFHLESDSRWELCGAEAGVTVLDGVATTTSTSITITISTAIAGRMSVTALEAETEAATTGSIVRSTAGE